MTKLDINKFIDEQLEIEADSKIIPAGKIQDMRFPAEVTAYVAYRMTDNQFKLFESAIKNYRKVLLALKEALEALDFYASEMEYHRGTDYMLIRNFKKSEEFKHIEHKANEAKQHIEQILGDENA